MSEALAAISDELVLTLFATAAIPAVLFNILVELVAMSR